MLSVHNVAFNFHLFQTVSTAASISLSSIFLCYPVLAYVLWSLWLWHNLITTTALVLPYSDVDGPGQFSTKKSFFSLATPEPFESLDVFFLIYIYLDVTSNCLYLADTRSITTSCVLTVSQYFRVDF